MSNTTRGRDSRGRFRTGSDAAVLAGRKGGKQAQANRTAHRLTKHEQSKGGANSHTTKTQQTYGV